MSRSLALLALLPAFSPAMSKSVLDETLLETAPSASALALASSRVNWVSVPVRIEVCPQKYRLGPVLAWGHVGQQGTPGHI